MFWDRYMREYVETIMLWCENQANIWSPIKIPFMKEYVDMFIDRDKTDFKNIDLHLK